MNEYLVTFLYELANFVVFALLLGWIFVKPIRRLLDEQMARDAKLEQTAQQHLAEAAGLRQQLLDDRQQFNREMGHQREAMLTETKQDVAELLNKARRDIAAQREQLSRQTMQLKQQQLAELARILANSSQRAVAKLLTQINGPPLEDALVESACQQLKQSTPLADGKLTVESAGELDESTRQKIALAAGFKSVNGAIQFRVDPDLLGGLRVTTTRGVIDNSIAALASFAERNIRSQLNHTG
jgi:F0F1-type ATP synthase membrane subunit b/b'